MHTLQVKFETNSIYVILPRLIRLDLPDSPFPVFIGVVYLPPMGARLSDENAALLDELDEKVTHYRRIGAVCIIMMGDFNIHIGDCPSTILVDTLVVDGLHDSGPVGCSSGCGTELTRFSVDILHRECLDGIPHYGREFIERMNNTGLVVLNGLSDIPGGNMAEATRVKTHSVVDYIMIDSGHWMNMTPVVVEIRAVAEVHSDYLHRRFATRRK